MCVCVCVSVLHRQQTDEYRDRERKIEKWPGRQI